MSTDLITEHTSRVREPIRTWRDPRYRVVLERTLRDLTLREVDRSGHAFAAQPVQTVHALADMDDQPVGGSFEDMVTTDTPLTPEQLDEMPAHSWIELRLTVPIRPLEMP